MCKQRGGGKQGPTQIGAGKTPKPRGGRWGSFGGCTSPREAPEWERYFGEPLGSTQSAWSWGWVASPCAQHPTSRAWWVPASRRVGASDARVPQEQVGAAGPGRARCSRRSSAAGVSHWVIFNRAVQLVHVVVSGERNSGNVVIWRRTCPRRGNGTAPGESSRGDGDGRGHPDGCCRVQPAPGGAGMRGEAGWVRGEVLGRCPVLGTGCWAQGAAQLGCVIAAGFHFPYLFPKG